MAEDAAPSPGKIRVKIVCPKKTIVDTEVDSLELPAELGIRLIIPNQAPLFCLLKHGRVVLNQKEKASAVYLISDGICEIRRNICAILAWAVAESEIDKTEIQEELKEAQDVLRKIELEPARQEVQNRIDFYQEILRHIGLKP